MKSSDVKSLFITFEGVEGSGKSLQARTLYRKLHRLAIPAILIHEPGSTLLGEKLARLLKQRRAVQISPVSELLLFNAARAQLVNDTILPSLKNGKIVVCDRYTDSTVAYQGYGRGLNLKTVSTANTLATGGLVPDLTILLDVTVNEGLARKGENSGDRFESEAIAFHERVRWGYLTMARKEPERFFVVDGQQDKRIILQIIWKRISEILRTRGS